MEDGTGVAVRCSPNPRGQAELRRVGVGSHRPRRDATVRLVPVQFHAGGSSALADIVDDYGEGIEADFQRFYGLDLRVFLVSPGFAPRALRLIKMLPQESATVAMVRAAKKPLTASAVKADPWRALYGWNTLHDLVADLWDLSSAKGTPRGKRPAVWPRPSSKQLSGRARITK